MMSPEMKKVLALLYERKDLIDRVISEVVADSHYETFSAVEWTDHDKNVGFSEGLRYAIETLERCARDDQPGYAYA